MGTVRLIINEWPRSGGTWLRDCLAEILGWQGPEWNDEPTPPEHTVTRVHRYPEAMPKGIPLIWLVRDPRDCVVSHYFMLRHNGDDWERPKDLTDFIQNYFMKGGLGGLLAGGFTRFCEVWLDSKRDYVIARQEKLMDGRFGQLRSLLGKLNVFDVDIDMGRVHAIVDKWSLSRRPVYGANYDRNKPDQLATIVAGTSTWQEYLTAEHLETLRDYCGDVASKLGYYL